MKEKVGVIPGRQNIHISEVVGLGWCMVGDVGMEGADN